MKQTSSKSFSLREKELAFVALYPLVSLDWRLKCTKVKKNKKTAATQATQSELYPSCCENILNMYIIVIIVRLSAQRYIVTPIQAKSRQKQHCSFLTAVNVKQITQILCIAATTMRSNIFRLVQLRYRTTHHITKKGTECVVDTCRPTQAH